MHRQIDIEMFPTYIFTTENKLVTTTYVFMPIKSQRVIYTRFQKQKNGGWEIAQLGYC